MKLRQFLAGVQAPAVHEAYALKEGGSLRPGPLALAAMRHGLDVQSDCLLTLVSRTIDVMLSKGVDPEEFSRFNHAWRIGSLLGPEQGLEIALRIAEEA